MTGLCMAVAKEDAMEWSWLVAKGKADLSLGWDKFLRIRDSYTSRSIHPSTIHHLPTSLPTHPFIHLSILHLLICLSLSPSGDLSSQEEMFYQWHWEGVRSHLGYWSITATYEELVWHGMNQVGRDKTKVRDSVSVMFLLPWQNIWSNQLIGGKGWFWIRFQGIRPCSIGLPFL